MPLLRRVGSADPSLLPDLRPVDDGPEHTRHPKRPHLSATRSAAARSPHIGRPMASGAASTSASFRESSAFSSGGTKWRFTVIA